MNKIEIKPNPGRNISVALPLAVTTFLKMTSTSPKGPYKLVTVNNAPERAKRLIGRVVGELADSYTIIHAANCASKHTRLILMCALWSWLT